MNPTNPVSSSDVTYLSLSMAAFASAADALSKTNYYLAAGCAVLGILLTYLYHAFGSPSIPEGQIPVTIANPANTPIATPTTSTTVTTPIMTTTATTNVAPVIPSTNILP